MRKLQRRSQVPRNLAQASIRIQSNVPHQQQFIQFIPQLEVSISTSTALEMLGRNHCDYVFAFVLAPCPNERESFESIDSHFLRRLSITGQWKPGRDEAIHRELIIQHLAYLGDIPILEFRVIQHYHHLTDMQCGSFLVSRWLHLRI